MKRPLVLLLVALSVAACGGGESLSVDDVALAADKTAEQKSARFEMTMRLSAPDGQQDVEVTADGEIDYENQRSRMQMDMGGLIEAMGGRPGEDFRLEALFDYPDFYMRLPRDLLGESGLPAGKEWVKVDLQKAGGVLNDFQQLAQSPADQMQMLRTVSDGVEEKGKDEIRGIETTRFHAVVDVQRVLDEGLKNVPEQQRAATARAMKQLIEQSGVRELPMDVWLDGDGVLRRMAMDTEIPLAGQSESMRMQMTMDLFDFGADVDIEPPPAAKVMDVTEEASTESA